MANLFDFSEMGIDELLQVGQQAQAQAIKKAADEKRSLNISKLQSELNYKLKNYKNGRII